MMSQNVDLISGQVSAAVTIYRFLVLGTDGKWSMVAGTSTEADGVAASGQANVDDVCPVATLKGGSILKIELGATLNAGDVVSSNSSGQAIAASATVGKYRLGKLLEGGSSGQVVRFLAFKERVEA